MSNPLARAWWRLVEGRIAHGIANTVGVPSGRRQQLRLDMQRAWLAAQLWHFTQRSSSAAPVALYQHLLQESQVVPKEESFLFVAHHIRQQLVGMATSLHHGLREAGDALPAANAMLQANAALAGQLAASKEHTGKAYLSQYQVSQLMRQRWGFSLQVKRSSIDHPEAGLGLFVQGHAPVGSVVALVPGVMYSRTQLSHMPNFPKVALDNPYLSSTIDMNVFDSKPWGLGVRQQHGPPTDAEGGHSIGASSSSSSSSSSSDQARDSSEQQGSASSSLHHQAGTHLNAASQSPAVQQPGKAAAYPSPSPACPPVLGYVCAHEQQGDGSMVQGKGRGSWSLTALEERHPWAWAHFANHPGIGMVPNVLEIPFDMDLAHDPAEAEAGEAGAVRGVSSPVLESGSAPSSTGNSRTSEQALDPCCLRAYVPCAPFMEPAPLQELQHKGWRRAAAEALLAASGWANTVSTQPQGGGQESEEEDLRPGPWLQRLLGLGSPAGHPRQSMRVQGIALIATRVIHDGEEVLLNYRLNPHTRRPGWYHSIDPEAESRRWAQMPLKTLLS